MTSRSSNGGIRVLLRGGLGNQMFQYAAGLALARRHEVPLLLDLALMKVDNARGLATHRDFALGPFGLEQSVVSGSLEGRKVNRMRRRLFRTPSRGTPHAGLQWFSESHPGYHSEFAALGSSVILDGYFQSLKYFESIQEEIREVFKVQGFASKETEELFLRIASEPAIGVHVRRGDYVTNRSAAKYHGVCTQEYYHRAVRLIQMDDPTRRVFVFSDDPTWCRDNLSSLRNVEIIQAPARSAHEDLWLLSGCSDFVISNSSFSWWAAWLGRPQATGQVIAPPRWLTNVRTESLGILPPDWGILP